MSHLLISAFNQVFFPVALSCLVFCVLSVLQYDASATPQPQPEPISITEPTSEPIVNTNAAPQPEPEPVPFKFSQVEPSKLNVYQAYTEADFPDPWNIDNNVQPIKFTLSTDSTLDALGNLIADDLALLTRLEIPQLDSVFSLLHQSSLDKAQLKMKVEEMKLQYTEVAIRHNENLEYCQQAKEINNGFVEENNALRERLEKARTMFSILTIEEKELINSRLAAPSQTPTEAAPETTEKPKSRKSRKPKTTATA